MSERQQESPLRRPRKSVSQSTISHPTRKDGQQSPPPKKARLNRSLKDDTPRYACRWMGCEFSGVPRFSTMDKLRHHCENVHFRENEEEMPIKNKRPRRNPQLESSFLEASNEKIHPKDVLEQHTNNLNNTEVDIDPDSSFRLPGPGVISNRKLPNEISSISVAAGPTQSPISSVNLNLGLLPKTPHDIMKYLTEYRADQFVEIMAMRKIKKSKENDDRYYILTEHGRLHLMPRQFNRSHLVSGDTTKEVNGRFYIDHENSMKFTSEIIAVLIPAGTDKIRLKIRWIPTGYIDDEWIDYRELPRKIMQLIPHRFTDEMDKLRQTTDNDTLTANFKKDEFL